MATSPIYTKLRHAAGIIKASQEPVERALSEDSVLLRGGDDTFVHVNYDSASGGIVLAFGGGPDMDRLVKDRYSGRANPEWAPTADIKIHNIMLQQFMSFVTTQGQQPTLLETIIFLSGGYIPRRVTCVGYHVGGGIAHIAAAWCAVTIPTADVRCVTFGSPRVGNKDFALFYVNVVSTSYRVVFGADPAPHHPRPVFFHHVDHVVWFQHGNIKFDDPPHLVQRAADSKLDNYLQAVWTIAGEPSRPLPPKSEQPELDVPAEAKSERAGGDEYEGDEQTERSWSSTKTLPKSGSIHTRGLPGRCIDDYELPVLEKALPAIILDSRIAQATFFAWRAYDDEDTFRKETGLSDARLLSYEELDTQVHVAWLKGGTALFAFRGTESIKDAQADLDARSDPVDFITEDFSFARGHRGFMRQFGSVTDANHPERHIGLVLEELSGGQLPTRVLCCGHSLGGALATLAAAWSAYEYPDADIRCITLGSPRVGNPTFVTAMRYLVGTSHRLIHGWDPVPTVPPPGPFKHVKGRIFLHKNAAKLKKRPWYMSYGALLGKVGDHNVDPYAAHITSVTGREIKADQLGLLGCDPDGKLHVQQVKPANGAAKNGMGQAGVVAAGAEGALVAEEAHAVTQPTPRERTATSGAITVRDMGTDPIWDGYGNLIE